MRTPAPLRVVALCLALALAPMVPGPVRAASTPETSPCASAFGIAGAITAAVRATGTDPSDTLTGALLDLTLAICPDADTWLLTAPDHADLLGGSDPEAFLAAHCTDPAGDPAARPGCVPHALVARPKVVPTVKGAQRTRTYAIVGTSPDQLFTQMQLNGSAGCPTHALACTNIQPRVAPRVTTGSTCRVVGVRAALSIEAVVPRWAGPKRVYPELAAWWRLAAKHIGTHEAQHIRIANQHLATLRRDIIGKPCSALQAYVTRWSRLLTAAQDAWDRKDAQRPWPVYEGPGS